MPAPRTIFRFTFFFPCRKLQRSERQSEHFSCTVNVMLGLHVYDVIDTDERAWLCASACVSGSHSQSLYTRLRWFSTFASKLRWRSAATCTRAHIHTASNNSNEAFIRDRVLMKARALPLRVLPNIAETILGANAKNRFRILLLAHMALCSQCLRDGTRLQSFFLLVFRV